MAFKENLLKKIQIDEVTARVLKTIGPVGGEQKVDKEIMRQLLEMGGYEYRRERDLDLYLKTGIGGRKDRILVLDNDLPVYRTSVEDVVLRKSPTVKEMVSIRNAIKILNDSDVKVSSKAESVLAIQKECVDVLDLSFDASDIAAITADGQASLKNSYGEGVIEALTIFAELLGYEKPPTALQIVHHFVVGAKTRNEIGESTYGPILLYSRMDNTLKRIDGPINPKVKPDIEKVLEITSGQKKPSEEGSAVFTWLSEQVLSPGGQAGG